MGYDLFFYKCKGQQFSENEIANYLTENLTSPNSNGNQWFFENEDTEVYFSFEQNEPGGGLEDTEMLENFEKFDNAHFSFNLNFLRPNFFGIEAFQFVDKFMSDLDLSVIDPQSAEPDLPRKFTSSQMLATWGNMNLTFSATKSNDSGFTYLPIEKSDDVWDYNFHKQKMQDGLGEGYYVPKVFMMKTKAGNNAITLTTWTESIPMIIPAADYYLLTRQYKKFFRTIKEAGLISYETLIKNFGSYLDNYDFKGCKIIHPNEAAKAKDIFNKVKLEYRLNDFCERVPMDKLVNAKT